MWDWLEKATVKLAHARLQSIRSCRCQIKKMWYSQSLKPSVQLHVNAPQLLQARPVLNVSAIRNPEYRIRRYASRNSH